MDDQTRKPVGPIAFTLQWLGIAVVVVGLVAVVAGAVRGDMAGTVGPVVYWGMSAAAIGLIVAVSIRKS